MVSGQSLATDQAQTMGEHSPDTLSPAASPRPKPPLPIRDRLFWFSISLSLLVGLTINLLPVTFKVFQKLFQAGFEMQGRVEMFYFIGALAGNIVAGLVTGRRGPTASVKRGLALGGLGCLLLGAAQNWLMAQAGAVLMGMGTSWLTVVYGTLTAHHFQEARQRVFAALALTMAIGGTLAPLGLGAYVDHAWMERGWPWGIPYIALMSLYLLTLLAAPSMPAGTSAPARSVGESRGRLRELLQAMAQFGRSLPWPLWLIGLAFTLHGIGQMGAVVWLGRLYETRLHLSETQVGWMISANITGFIAGRMIWTYFGGRIPERILLGCSAGWGATFYVLTILSGSYPLGLMLIFVAGMGMSGDAISLQSFTALRFRRTAAQAFGFTQALGHLGAAMGPYFIGFMGDISGTIEQAVWVIPITITLLSLLGFVWHFLDRSAQKPGAS